MTNVFPNVVADTKLVFELTELNVKTVTGVVESQAKLFNDLMTSGLTQVKKLQGIKDVNGFIDASKSYSEEVNGKIRKVYDANSSSIEAAGKQGLEIISNKQQPVAATAEEKAKS